MNWIQVARFGRGYTLAELARITGFSASRISRIENDLRVIPPSHQEICYLSDVLEVPHDALFCLPPRYADPKGALEEVLYRLEPFQRRWVADFAEHALRRWQRRNIHENG